MKEEKDIIQRRNNDEKRCTLVGMTSDVFLSVLKIATGIVGHSSAILADGIHSISDTVTDALVYAMVVRERTSATAMAGGNTRRWRRSSSVSSWLSWRWG